MWIAAKMIQLWMTAKSAHNRSMPPAMATAHRHQIESKVGRSGACVTHLCVNPINQIPTRSGKQQGAARCNEPAKKRGFRPDKSPFLGVFRPDLDAVPVIKCQHFQRTR